ncbi:MAG: hypothetical protein D8M59_07680 [Planctomycetes bacterium]|nr:hypothetical protein [Planctomycetota bacterium]NOG53207.1 AAA domain-containing protein [Planctomycetota bacterium]
MPNLLYPYLVGVISTVVLPLAALIAYVWSHMACREYERLRRRLPLAVRYEDLQDKVTDLQRERDALQEELFAGRDTLDEAQRERAWLDQHRQEVEEMRAEQAQLEQHRVEYEETIRKLAEASEKLDVTVRSKKEAEFDLEQRQSQIADATKKENDLAQQIVQAAQRLRTTEDDLRKTQKALQKVEESRRGAQEKAARARSESAELEGRLNQMKQERKDLQAKVKSLASDIEKYDTKEASLKSSCSALQTQVDSMSSWLDEMRAEARIRDKHIATADEALNELLEPVFDGSELAPANECEDEDEMLKRVEDYLESHRLRFPRRVICALHTSLKVADQTPLLVLAGISGTGKSLLPRRYAEAMGIHFLNVPVQPRWDGPQDLTGFFNYLENRYKATELMRALIQFDPYTTDWTEQDKFTPLNPRMLLVLLDEMNLARVEYYFSEFLSRLETRRDIDHKFLGDRAKASLLLDVGDVVQGTTPRTFVDRNVMFVGTMNEDESTMTLSDKVIDRAGILRFGRPSRLDAPEDNNANPSKLRAKTFLARSTWEQWIEEGLRRELPDDLNVWILQVNEALARVGRPFGYRTRDAMLAYVRQYPDQSDEGRRLAFADQVEQRILPKIRGLDLSEDGVDEAIHGIAEVVRSLDDQPLALAIEQAQSPSTGHLFAWSGVERVDDA